MINLRFIKMLIIDILLCLIKNYLLIYLDYFHFMLHIKLYKKQYKWDIMKPKKSYKTKPTMQDKL